MKEEGVTWLQQLQRSAGQLQDAADGRSCCCCCLGVTAVVQGGWVMQCRAPGAVWDMKGWCWARRNHTFGEVVGLQRCCCSWCGWGFWAGRVTLLWQLCHSAGNL